MAKELNVLINSVALFVTMGPRNLGAACPSLTALFTDHGETDDLYPTLARTQEGSAVKSGHIAGLPLSDQ